MRTRNLIAGAAALVGFGLMAAPASAQEYPGPSTPPEEVVTFVEVPTEVLPSTEVRGGTLPVTGGDVAVLAAIGAGSVAAGAAVLGSRRARVKA